jgi:hypothetical protein
MSDSLISDTASADTGDTGDTGDTMSTPAEFSLYKDGAIHPDLESYFDDSNKAARGYMEAHKSAENPTRDFLNSISDLRKIASQKERTRPDDDASDEDKATWNSYIKAQLGVPDDAKGYGWERPEDIGEDTWNQEQVNVFANILHEGNVDPQTAAKLFEAYGNDLRGAPEAVQAQIDQQLAVERDKLNAEYGMETDKMIKAAQEGGNLKGISQPEIERIASTAEGVKLLAGIKNMHVADITSNTQSSNGMSQGGNSNYEEQAMNAGLKAVEAHGRGDMASYKKFSEQQSHFNQLHANASR